MRTLAVSLAMTTRPALLQLAAVDFTGRELSVLETLPHASLDTATAAGACSQSVAWLAAELSARRAEGRRWPEMLLVIDELQSLAAPACARSSLGIMRLLREGGGWGMHVLAGVAGLTRAMRSAGWSRRDVARITLADEPCPSFLHLDGSAIDIRPVRLSAFDLDRVSRGYRRVGAAARWPSQATGGDG